MNEDRRSFASQYRVILSFSLSLSLSLSPLGRGGGALLGSTPHPSTLARPNDRPSLEQKYFSLSLSLFPSVFCPFPLVHHLAHRTSWSPYPSTVLLHHFIVKDIGMSMLSLIPDSCTTNTWSAIAGIVESFTLYASQEENCWGEVGKSLKKVYSE